MWIHNSRNILSSNALFCLTTIFSLLLLKKKKVFTAPLWFPTDGVQVPVWRHHRVPDRKAVRSRRSQVHPQTASSRFLIIWAFQQHGHCMSVHVSDSAFLHGTSLCQAHCATVRCCRRTSRRMSWQLWWDLELCTKSRGTLVSILLTSLQPQILIPELELVLSTLNIVLHYVLMPQYGYQFWWMLVRFSLCISQTH